MKVYDNEPGEPWDWDGWGYESNFATQMRERREAKGWSQTEMAKRLTNEGIKFHQTTIQRVEMGRRPLKLTEAMVIANVLGVKFEIMLRGDSIELAYNELSEQVRSGAFDFLVRDAERLERSIKSNIEMTGELIGHYTRATSSVPGAQPDTQLLTAAMNFVQLNETLQSEAHTLAMLLKVAKKTFDGLDRDYSAQYYDEPNT